MGRYRKRPVVIDAFQWGGGGSNWPHWLTEARPLWSEEQWVPEANATLIAKMMIPTLEGVMTAYPGDWIIRGIKGEVYPCKPDIFAATYEVAE